MKRALAIGLVWLQAFVHWIGSDSPYVPIAAAGITLLSVCLPIRARLSTKWWRVVVLGVAAGALTVGFWMPYEAAAESGALPAQLTMPLADFLLLAQALQLLLRGPAGTSFPVLAAAGCFCVFNQTTDLSLQTMFLALAILSTAACAWLFQGRVGDGRRSIRRSTSPGNRQRRFIVGGSLLAAAVAAWLFAGLWEQGVARAQVLLPVWMARSGGRDRAIRAYVQTGTLTSISSEKRTYPMEVAIRVYSRRPPGYLRGRVFDTYYHRSGWQLAAMRRGRRGNRIRLMNKNTYEALPRVPQGIEAPGEDRSLFQISEMARPPFVTMEIHNDPSRGEMFFTPLAASYVEAEANHVVTDEHGIIHAGINRHQPYLVYATRAMRTILSPGVRDRLLEVPDGLDEGVLELAESVCLGASTASEKIEAVVSYFHDSFEYSSDAITIPRDAEPISHFLLNRPPAHCEFFASGAAVVLRMQGVPCRYVTGYIVTELEREYGDYWQARNRNAHAWVEAYDDQRQRWVVVEATPGIYVPSDAGLVIGADDRTGQSDELGTTSLTTEYPWLDHRWLFRSWSSIGEAIRFGLLTTVIGLGIGFPLYRRLRQTRARFNGDRHLAQVQRTLTRLDRQLRRRNLARLSHETLHQFALRLREKSSEDAWLGRCADWYITYANARYAGTLKNELDRLSFPK